MRKKRLYSIAVLTSIILLSEVLSSCNDKPKERYFFVGYTSSQHEGSFQVITHNGSFISGKVCIDNLKKKYTGTTDFILTSVYEFPTEKDHKQFYSKDSNQTP